MSDLETTRRARPRRRRSSRRGRNRRRSSGIASRRHLLRALKGAPRWVRYALIAAILLAAAFLVNGIYQVIHKPTEVFMPVGTVWNKTPAETWKNYGAQFRKQSTATISPELLAALAQTEGAGNPVPHTYWRWGFSFNPLHIYQPASSSVGMYQITDGTFGQARRYCIRNHQVRSEGAWNDWDSCWFNSLYFRVLPSDSIQLTAAYLDVSVNDILSRNHRTAASLAQKQRLAAMVHLCGAGAADTYARRGFRTGFGQRCGDHDPAVYLAHVKHLQEIFAGLAMKT